MTNREIARQRLRNQRLTLAGCRRAPDVVSWFGAMQAQEYEPAKWALGLRTAVLVAVPCPEDVAVPSAEMAEHVDAALEAAARARITGPALTPFLLHEVAKRTEGRSLRANLALLENNARVAGRIAVALAELGGSPAGMPLRVGRPERP